MVPNCLKRSSADNKSAADGEMVKKTYTCILYLSCTILSLVKISIHKHAQTALIYVLF